MASTQSVSPESSTVVPSRVTGLTWIGCSTWRAPQVPDGGSAATSSSAAAATTRVEEPVQRLPDPCQRLLMGAGCALANPAIVEAVMGAIPSSSAGAGAGVDGIMSEVGTALGVAVLGAVMHSRFVSLLPVAAASFPAAMALAGTEPERQAVTSAFAAGLATGQLAGAGVVLAGGLIAAGLLQRSARS